MREEYQSASQHGESSVKHFMDSMGLGMLAEQVKEDTVDLSLSS